MGAKRNEFHAIGRDAMLGMLEALEKGRPLTRREVILPDPPAQVTPREMVRLRVRTFRVSQQVFARLLNVSPKTVQGWEQGRNSPVGATLRLLRVAQRHPQVLVQDLRAKGKSLSRREDYRKLA
jgi:putative transcriptional regulator